MKPKKKQPEKSTETMLMVYMDAEGYEALKQAADALHLRGRGAMIRALSQSLMHKDIAAVRRFLFLDEGDLPRKP